MRLKATTAIALITSPPLRHCTQGRGAGDLCRHRTGGLRRQPDYRADLQAVVETLIATPSAEALQAAKSARWLAARVPYQQTEVFRFGNAIVDDWEGKVNAWPLDEGLIDYVDAPMAARRMRTNWRF